MKKGESIELALIDMRIYCKTILIKRMSLEKIKEDIVDKMEPCINAM